MKLLLALLLCLAPAASFAAGPVPGQKTLLIVGDAFQFVSGSWAAYRVTDKAKQETYRIKISILDRTLRKQQPFWWMEIEVEPPKDPVVVTKMLVEETSQGPGEIQEVIVQASGYSPFRVPKKYYQGKPEDRQVKPVQPAHVVKRLEKKSLVRNGRTLQAVEMEAEDSQGRPLGAIVSEELPPIGVCEAENDEVRMELADWGGGARSAITGTPLNFYLWIMQQLGKAL
jgi:hypothetical protein